MGLKDEVLLQMEKFSWLNLIKFTFLYFVF